MKRKNHELTLPEGYREIYHINALDTKTGLILNLIALVVLALVMALAFIPFFIGICEFVFDVGVYMICSVVFLIAMVAYIVLHELVHGAAYKALTGEKLTYGFSWSCAYCGVPNVYVYRGASLIALLAPFVVFTLLFIPLTIWMYFVHPFAYIMCAALLGMHIGGCSGDLYLTILFIFKLRDKTLLMRDTGPEQFFYARDVAVDATEGAV